LDELLRQNKGLLRIDQLDPAVREPLAKGLFNAFRDAERNSSRANALRQLADAHPNDPAVTAAPNPAISHWRVARRLGDVMSRIL
jgi:hypothetical protein